MDRNNDQRRHDDVVRQLDQVQSIVSTARRLLAQGNSVDLAKLEARVEEFCAQVPTLPEETRKVIRPKMVALIDELNSLSREMKEQYEYLRQNLSELAVNRRAQAAYRRPTGGS